MVLGYEGILRDVFLVLDGIQFFICIELTFLFFIRGIKKRRSSELWMGISFFEFC